MSRGMRAWSTRPARRSGPLLRRTVAALVAFAAAAVTLAACAADTTTDATLVVGATPPPADSSAGTAAPTADTDGPAGTPTGVPPAAVAKVPASQTHAFRPTSLVLPSGVVAPVDPAGVHGSGALAVPDDPARLGWWTGGALADEPFGSVVIAGHVDSSTAGLGAMVELLDVEVGAEIVAGNEAYEQLYRVVSRTAVAKVRLVAEAEPFRQDVDHRLVLITCGGDFDESVGSYTDNVVVVAEPVG